MALNNASAYRLELISRCQYISLMARIALHILNGTRP